MRHDTKNSTLSTDLCRAARGLLHWTQTDLKIASGVATKTIADYERGARTPYDRTLRDLREAFEAAGIEFTNGDAPGLRLKPRRRSRESKK
jgi:transcriptional regulator with XRE-family HTH domain